MTLGCDQRPHHAWLEMISSLTHALLGAFVVSLVLPASAFSQASEEITHPNPDGLYRTWVERPPELSSHEVFRWGLMSEGLKRYGIYGRLLPSAQGQAPALMYRGYATIEARWIPLDKGKAPPSLSALERPETFEDLERFTYEIKKEIHVTTDRLQNEEGWTLNQRYLYQLSPPFSLIAFEQTLRTPHKEEQATLSDQQLHILTQIDGTRSEKYEAFEGRTLQSQRLTVSQFHTGSSFPLHRLSPSHEHQQSVKIVDRRFERINGLWVETVELTINPSKSDILHSLELPESLVMTPDGDVKSFRFHDGLLVVPQPIKMIERRDHLSIDQAPLELTGLQRRPGKLDPVVLQRAFAPFQAQLNTCLSPHPAPKKTPTPLILRLGLDKIGRLQAASVTSSSHWKISRCVLRSLQKIQFPKPSSPTDLTLSSPLSPSRIFATLAFRLNLLPPSLSVNQP